MFYGPLNPRFHRYNALEVSDDFRGEREGNLLVFDVPSTVLAAIVSSSRETLIAVAVLTTVLTELNPVYF